MKVICEQCRGHGEVNHPGKFRCSCGHLIEVPDPASNLALCPDCGHLVSKAARDCPACGCPLAAKNKLSGSLIFTLWTIGLLLPPFTSLIVIVTTSILHHNWKRDFPAKAAAIRRQGWWIFAAGIVGTMLMAVLTVQAIRTILGELGPLLQ